MKPPDNRMKAGSLSCGMLMFERFRIMESLGEGGQGEVYKAFDDATKQVVALKIPKASEILDENSLERHRREVHSLEKLALPGVCRLIDYSSTPGESWLCMELVEGQSIASVGNHDNSDETISQQRWSSVCGLIENLAHTLSLVHDQGIIHRDIKPQNVIIRNGVPVLVDFGFSHYASNAELTKRGQVPGTIYYLAPERVRGDPATPASDVFSLGVLLYELIVGQRPFVASSEIRLLEVLTSEEPAPRVGRGIPLGLESILETALEKRVEYRYISAKAMADDLGRLLRNERVVGRHVTLSKRVEKVVRRHPIITLAILAIALFVSIGVIVWSTIRESQSKEKLAREQSKRSEINREFESLKSLFDRGDFDSAQAGVEGLSTEARETIGSELVFLEAEISAAKRGEISDPIIKLIEELMNSGEQRDRGELVLIDSASISLGSANRIEKLHRLANSEELSPSDRMYAAALCSESIDKRIDLLTKSIAADPRNLRARRSKLMTLLQTGRFGAISDEVLVLRSLYPDDPRPGLALAWSQFLTGNRTAAMSTLDELRNTSVATVAGINREFFVAMMTATEAPSDDIELSEVIKMMLKAYIVMKKATKGDYASAIQDIPYAAIALDYTMGIVGVSTTMLLTRPWTKGKAGATELDKVIAKYPDGYFYHVRAVANLGEIARADKAAGGNSAPLRDAILADCAKAQSVGSLLPTAWHSALQLEIMVLASEFQQPEAGRRVGLYDRLANKVFVLLADSRTSSTHIAKIAPTLVKYGPIEIGRMVLEIWDRKEPKSEKIRRLMLELEMRSANWLKAIELCREILTIDAEDEDIQEALRKSEEEARRALGR